MKKLRTEFSNKRISRWDLDRFFSKLKDESPTKKELDLRDEYLKSTMVEILKYNIIPKNILDDFEKAKRIAIKLTCYLSLDSELVDKYLGITDLRIINDNKLNYSFYVGSDLELPEYRKPENRDSYWRNSIKLDPALVKDKKLREKLVVNFCAYRKAYNNNNNFLEIDYGLKGVKSVGFLYNYTYGKLYKFNKEWFNKLVDYNNISEDTIYEEVVEDADKSKISKTNDELVLINLKKELEK